MITSSDIEVEKDRGGLQTAIGVEVTKYDRAGLQIVISFGLQLRQKFLKIDYKVRWDYKPRRITK